MLTKLRDMKAGATFLRGGDVWELESVNDCRVRIRPLGLSTPRLDVSPDADYELAEAPAEQATVRFGGFAEGWSRHLAHAMQKPALGYAEEALAPLEPFDPALGFVYSEGVASRFRGARRSSFVVGFSSRLRREVGRMGLEDG
jgi:hypothetical protein